MKRRQARAENSSELRSSGTRPAIRSIPTLRAHALHLLAILASSLERPASNPSERRTIVPLASAITTVGTFMIRKDRNQTPDSSSTSGIFVLYWAS
jgi:hypothetical protein